MKISMAIEIQIEIIKAKLAELSKLDSDRCVFGSTSHRFARKPLPHIDLNDKVVIFLLSATAAVIF